MQNYSHHKENLNWFWTGSETMKSLENQLNIVSRYNIPILIVGETGSGKELVAKKIWQYRLQNLAYSKAEAPFVPINVSTIPESLAESILFGHERGAFTSARERQIGKFERAQKGCIFLDEIQNLDLSIQSKLLRVLQSRELDRLGSKTSTEINCQVIAATNIPLEILCKEEKFRHDLYYRLNSFPIYLPSLRQRRSEISHIINQFIKEGLGHHKIRPKELSADAQERLSSHIWHGNFRELEHSLVYAHLKSQTERIGEGDLPPHIIGQTETYLSEGNWR